MNEKEIPQRGLEHVSDMQGAGNRKSRRQAKIEVDLPTIEFDGHHVKPVRGSYSCPHRCGDKRFHQPTWKTEKGFRGHMLTCAKGSPAQEIKAEREAEIFAKMADFVESHEFAHQVGDVVHFVFERVVLPSYKNGRRVRYEDKLAYSAKTITIEKLAAFLAGSLVPAYVGNGFTVRESELHRCQHDSEKH